MIGSIQYALQRLGVAVPPADELLWMIGPPFRLSFPRLLGSSDRTEEAITYYRESYFSGAMYDAIVYDGIPEALDALAAAGCRLIVATSKPHHYARPILQHFGLAHRFLAIHGPELDGTRDAKTQLIAHIIAEHGVHPGTAVMIGDREFDATAAGSNGMRTLGVTWGYGTIGELNSAGAAAICASPVDLAQAALALLRTPASAA